MYSGEEPHPNTKTFEQSPKIISSYKVALEHNYAIKCGLSKTIVNLNPYKLKNVNSKQYLNRNEKETRKMRLLMLASNREYKEKRAAKKFGTDAAKKQNINLYNFTEQIKICVISKTKKKGTKERIRLKILTNN